MKRIISVSRRTDVPAFYGNWFINRVQEGDAGYRNPFGGKKYSVSLRMEDVHAFVFWSKNYAPFITHLETLKDIGYHFYFQFTITGLPEILETNTPDWQDAVSTARRLAKIFSPDHIIWRFDPVVFSSVTPPDSVLETFRNILGEISGSTRSCYFSFVDYYGKVLVNFEKLHAATGVKFRADTAMKKKLPEDYSSPAFSFDLTTEEQSGFAKKLAEAAAEKRINLYACCEDFLVAGGNPPVLRGHCVDPELITEITGAAPGGRFNPTRKDCGCWESRDIGAYDTCPHGCVYCYANTNKEVAFKKYDLLKNDPRSFSLAPGVMRDEFPQLYAAEPLQTEIILDD